jgi:uncharacterized cupredoxin-like copper-binding protein
MRRAIACATAALLVTGVAIAVPASRHFQEVTLILRNYSLTPKLVTLRAGEPAKLVLVNQGNLDHEFQVYPPPKVPPQDWNTYAMTNTYFKGMGEIDVALSGEAEIGATSVFKVHVAPGARITLWFTPRDRGVFEMASHDPGQYEKGMKGTLVVR